MSSAIEQLFEQIFNSPPAMGAQAHDRLAAAVCALFRDADSVFGDPQMPVTLSRVLNQIDEMKLAGKELADEERGAFFTAASAAGTTGRDAQAAGAGAGQAGTGQAGPLIYLRSRAEENKEGRLARVVVEVHAFAPDYASAQFAPEFTDEGYAKAQALAEAGKLNMGENRMSIDRIYNLRGEVYCTFRQLTSLGFSLSQDNLAEGTYSLPDCAIRCGEELLPIAAIHYRVPLTKSLRELQIIAEGRAMLLAKEEGLSREIADHDLRRVGFDDAGRSVVRE